MMPEVRPCFILREVQIPMEKVQAGDIFRLGKASDTDDVDEFDYFVATTDARPHKIGKIQVEATEIKMKTHKPLRWGMNTKLLERLKAPPRFSTTAFNDERDKCCGGKCGGDADKA